MNAPEKAREVKAGIAAGTAFLTAIWGWIGWAAMVWIACMVIDYAAGTACAKKEHNWASSVARAGLWHKLGEVFAVLVAALCDIALHVIISGAGVQAGAELPNMVTPVVLLWYIITELGSIAENAGRLGAPVPGWLMRSLEEFRGKIDEKGAGEMSKEDEKNDMEKTDM